MACWFDSGLNAAYWYAGKVIGSVCHGPAGILEATGPDGKSIISGKKCTGFCNTEEEAVGKTDKVPFLLEDRMKALGGKYEKKGDWSDFSLCDGRLVTGEHNSSQPNHMHEYQCNRRPANLQ